MFRSKVKNLVFKFFLKSLDLDQITKIVNYKNLTDRNKACIANSVLGDGSQFYEEAIVYNAQSKEKILIGNDTHIRAELLIFKYGGQIRVGNNCYLGKGTRVWSGESVYIGNNVLISHNVNIMDTNSHEISSNERACRYRSLIESGPWEDKGSIITSKVVIQDDVWISFGSIILKGVTIGQGAIVGAGSVVTKNVPEWTVVGGNPE